MPQALPPQAPDQSTRRRAATLPAVGVHWTLPAPLKESLPALLRVWRVARFAVFLVPCVMLLTILTAIWTHTSQVPWFDEWNTVPLIQHLHQGTLTFGDITAFHNEHRIAFPTLVTLVLIELTHWNRQVEMTFDLMLALASGALLFLTMRRTTSSLNTALLASVPASLLLFTYTEYQNWLWAFQITFIMTVTAAMICMWALSAPRAGWRAWAFAAGGAFVASYSSLAGLLLWIAFLPSILRMGWRKTLAWCGTGLVVWVLYFIGFPQVQHPRVPLSELLTYFLAYLGGPLGAPLLSRSVRYAVVGLVLFVLTCAAYWLMRRDLTRALPWIGLALFSFGCAAITTYGRASAGVYEALSSRYEAFSGLWWISLVALVAITVEEFARVARPAPVWRLMSPTTVLAVLVGLNLIAALVLCRGLLREQTIGYAKLETWASYQVENQGCILRYQTASDACLATYYPDPSYVRRYVPYLRQEHLGIFAQP